MNVLSRLSLRNLKANKKRTVSTIIGIILSVALICAVAGMGTSFRESLIVSAINEYGYWHVKLVDITEEQQKEVESSRDVKDCYSVDQCGYATLKGSKNEYKPYVKLFSMDEEMFKNLKLTLMEGRFAENNQEIVISDHIHYNGGVDMEIGDKITLNVGERTLPEDYDYAATEGNPLFDETITNETERTFTVVGIIERPSYGFEEFSEAGYTVISTDIESRGNRDLYVSLEKPKDYKESIAQLLGVSDYDELKSGEEVETAYDYVLNQELLRWEAFGFSDDTVLMLYRVIGVVLFIILFTSVFCIRNSFAIATTEKMKMYSMLASVGTTKKQIRKNVLTEGLMLGTIGIPLGILSGFSAVFVLIKIVNALVGDMLFRNMDGLVFKLSWEPVVISVVLGLLTILLSVRSSARKAAKVSPIDGLRSANEIKIKGKKLKVPRMIAKLFKTGGVLAYKNLKRSRKKYRTTVISIAVSIFVFVTMNVLVENMFDMSEDYYKDYGYNITVTCEEDVLDKVLSQENIESCTALGISAENRIRISDLGKMNYEDESELSIDEVFNEETGEYEQEGERYCELEILAMDAEDFQSYVEGLGLKYKNVKDKGILCDEIEVWNAEKGKTEAKRRYTYQEGEEITGTLKEEPYSVSIGTITAERPKGMEGTYSNGGYLVVNKDFYKDLEFSYYNLAIKSKNANQLEQDLLSLNEGDGIIARNIEKIYRQMRAMNLVVEIFLYGFIAVISLIGVTNIFNTITSNMELRQKEFAMLKSVGMTKKEFNRMVNLETIFYGTKAWIYGVIMGILGTLALYKAFAVDFEEGVYFPFSAILISALFVFVFVFVIMHYSIQKINKQNTIETIRKETV